MVSPPTLTVYVLVPQIDPIGHRMGLDLAALIREVRAETGCLRWRSLRGCLLSVAAVGFRRAGVRPVRAALAQGRPAPPGRVVSGLWGGSWGGRFVTLGGYPCRCEQHHS